MMRALLICVIAFVAACSETPTTSEQPPVERTGVETHGLYRCKLVGGTETPRTGTTTGTVQSPFAFIHMSRPGEPNRFGIASSGGNTVGIGQLQTDCRWLISNWAPKTPEGPYLTLVTFLPDESALLLSVSTGPESHVTFGGTCEAQG